jgi:phosphate-selective porin OprO/OprP
MHRTLLTAVLVLLAAQAAPGQPTAPPSLVPAFNQTSSPPSLQPTTAQADDIQSLRASIRQLQERLDRLSPPAAGKVAPSAPWMPQLPIIQTKLAKDPTCFSEVNSLGLPWESCQANGAADWPMYARWNYGLEVVSRDEAFRVHVGGQLQFDHGWNAASQTVQFGPGGTGEFQDGAYFRRARIRIDGTMYDHFEWVAEFDFANNIENDTSSSPQTIGSPSFIEVWFGINDIPYLGTVRVGWMKEPIGFEHLTSTRWLNFMERAPGTDSLTLTSPGILVRDWSADERLTWAFGFFHAQNDNFGFGVGDGQYAETGRLTWLPWYEDDGRELLHLGFGASHRHLVDNQVDLHGRPSVRTEPSSMEPSLAETGTIDGTTQDLLGLELAGVYGPWTLQSEYFATWIHDAVFPNEPPPMGIARGTLFYQAAYVEVLYFLTGEYRAYDRRAAVFDRVIPRRNFNIWSGEYGCGAWQVGIRYGYLDLQNKGVNGATLNDIVLGLNWFLNPNAKLQWNLAIDHRESTPPGSSGWTYIFGGRLAVDF